MPHGRRRRLTKVERLILGFKLVIAFLLSHVGLCVLVIAYTIFGALVFQVVEGPFEVEIQHLVTNSRRRAVDAMWDATLVHNVLEPRAWRRKVYRESDDFREVLLYAIRRGYDGIDHIDNSQFTLAGAYLYSLTVITTIGYGNIACRTYLGKAVTICYAIIGVPLMLLFLTNIGDVFAQVFTFVYRKTLRLELGAKIWRKRQKLTRLKQRLDVFTATLGLAPAADAGGPDEQRSLNKSTAHFQRQKGRQAQQQKFLRIRDNLETWADETSFVGSSVSAGSLRRTRHYGNSCKTLSRNYNTYGAENDQEMHDKRSTVSAPSFYFELDPQMSFAEQQHYFLIINRERKNIEKLAQDIRSLTLQVERSDARNVPLWLVLFTMIVYLMIGAVMFAVWEKWDFLDSFYFCFISLTTVGFGDLFPGLSVSTDEQSAQDKLAITSFYLLFGMALIAMCFNLAQEEVVNIVTRLAVRLSIFKPKEMAAAAVVAKVQSSSPLVCSNNNS